MGWPTVKVFPCRHRLHKPESRENNWLVEKQSHQQQAIIIILVYYCLHDVQDMSGYHHPAAYLHKGEYGCVGQGLHS